MSVKGLDQLQATLHQFASNGQLLAALRPEMNRLGSKVLARSIGLTPRDRGALANSAGLEVRSGSKSVDVTLGYSAKYALFVHENPRAGKTGGVSPSGRRYKHWAVVGQYKYLETALREAEHGAWDDVARGLESWLRRQGR